MKKLNRFLSLLMVLVMVVSLLPTAALAVVEGDSAAPELTSPSDYADYSAALRENRPSQGTEEANDVSITKIDNPGVELKKNDTALEQVEVAEPAADEMVDVIVVMEDKSLLDRGYTTAQIASANGTVAGVSRQLYQKQEDLLTRINRVVNNGAATFGLKEQLEITAKYHYDVVFSGFAITVPYGALAEINALDGVKKAFVATVFSVPEDMSDGSVGTYMYETKDLFGSAQAWEELGYTGAGMRIAILDTGLDTDHPAFTADPPLTENSLTVEEIGSVLTELNAYQWYKEDTGKELTAEDLYISAKIPFGYSYGFNNPDVTHDKDVTGTHGTHVAGIAAANAVEGSDVVGVAPDAQIIAMKVFNSGGGASSIDIFAAIEDAYRLNVDVMNLSLGSDGGFTEEDELFEKITKTDMIVSISAGNAYSSAQGNGWGTDTNRTQDPDNGIVGWPATTVGATVVASMENNKYMTMYFTITATGEKCPYTDASLYDADAYYAGLCFYTLGDAEGVDYEYIMIPGYGAEEDFAGLDVSGKIAVIQRGELAFTEKQTNAYNAGAVACIVYDNLDESESGMLMQNAKLLPNIFVSKAVGLALAAQADENGVGTLTVMPYEAQMAVDSPTAGQMSSFSSWGATPDLRLVPDVTAPGGNIYSTVDGGEYDSMSGTSMAAPHITGMSALVLQYLREEHPEVLEGESHTVAEALIMSTAEPVLESSGYPYSPRKQGAGLANVYSALSSASYLTVNGGKPSVSLGDDAAKTGVYEFSFEVNNLTGEEQTYALGASVLTDMVDLTYAQYGYYFMGETSMPLDAEVEFSGANVNFVLYYDVNRDGAFDIDDVQYLLDYVNGLSGKTIDREEDYDLTEDGVLDTADVQCLKELLGSVEAEAGDTLVTVPANGRSVITVKVTLTEDDKAYLDYFYPNGIYVEGFIRCYSIEDGSDLSLPYMGFYGDWSAARLFDSEGLFDESAEWGYNIVFTDFGSSYFGLGLNYYDWDEDYDPAHNVLSPNGDTYQDNINDIYLYLMRGAKYLDFNWLDSEGNVLWNGTAEDVSKTIYNYEYAQPIPFIYSYYFYSAIGADGYPIADVPDLSELIGEDSSEIVELTLAVDGYLDDGDLVPDGCVEIPIVLDVAAPEIADGSWTYLYNEYDDSRRLEFYVSDNYDIAAVVTLTTAGDPIEYIRVDGEEPGQPVKVTIDVSGYDSTFLIAVCDYGCNENYYQVSFEGKINADTNAFYGYRRMCVIPYNGYLYISDAYNGWYSFKEPGTMLMHSDAYYSGETAVAAAEFIDGYVIGVDVNGTIFASESGDWSNRTVVGTLELDGEIYPALDMAFDYTTETLYILTDELSTGSGGHLVAMDYLTGELTDLGTLRFGSNYYSQGITLACDNDGVLYTVDYSQWASNGYESGVLYTISVEYDEMWDETYLSTTMIGDTGYQPESFQSMTVDHSTNKLYWAAYQGYAGSSVLYEVDKSTGALTEVGAMEYNSEMTALFKPYRSGKALYPTEAVELEGLILSETRLVMAVGNEAQLLSRPLPYYAEIVGEISWESSDENVAIVDENGVVTAVGAGEAVITASLDGKSVTCSVRVEEIDADLYVYDSGSDYMWLSFNACEPQYADYVYEAVQPNGAYDAFIAATYTVDGVIYAYDTAGGFYRIDAETMQGVRLGTNTNVNGTSGFMAAMTFSPADGNLYGITQTGGMWESYFNLVRINPSNGDFVVVADLSEYMPLNLAVAPDGTFYSVTDLFDYFTYESSTVLLSFTLDEYDEVNVIDTIPLQGFSSGYGSYNSLVYSSGNEGLFWADYYGHLLWIDPDNGESINLGDIGFTAYYYPSNVCLIEIPEVDPDVSFAEPDSVTMASSFLLLEGGSCSANVVVEPWNARASLSYTVDDESVAEVDESGTITGIAAGETTLSVYVAETGEILSAVITVVPSAGYLYGNVITDLVTGAGNFWIEMSDIAPEEAMMVYFDSEDDGFVPFSGAYYGGSVYVYSQGPADLNYKYYLLKIDVDDGDYSSYDVMGQIHETIRDMDFDYTTGTMYAVVQDGVAVGALAQVNLETAEVCIIGDTGHVMAAMTVDGKGNIFAIGEDANLYQIDKVTAEATLIGATGVKNVSLFQSMHYDVTTGNTYWAQTASDYTNGLYLIDLSSGSATSLGTVGTGAEVGVLYTIPETEPIVPEIVEPTGVALTEKTAVVVGETVELRASVLPYSVASVDQTLTWSSSDESIATVEDGVVAGISSGTVVITATASNGVSATCTVTVTDEARRFYAYDKSNAQWISFLGEDTSDVRVERVDEEGESNILAACYTGEVLYAYDEDGIFYTIDLSSFERTPVGQLTDVEYEAYDSWWDEYYWGTLYAEDLSVVDMSYDDGVLYALVFDGYNSAICTVDVEDGSLEFVYLPEARPGNLLVENGRAFFVDTYYSGILTYVDLYADSPEEIKSALVPGYWGDNNTSVGLIRDEATGVIYTIRDMTEGSSKWIYDYENGRYIEIPWDGVTGNATLYTLNLGDADIQEIGAIGDGTLVINSLFIK